MNPADADVDSCLGREKQLVRYGSGNILKYPAEFERNDDELQEIGPNAFGDARW